MDIGLKRIGRIFRSIFTDYRIGRKNKIFAVMAVRNEAYHLPTFLKSISKYVDGIIALDDGSTDGTAEILEGCRKVVKIIKSEYHESPDWDERGNRERVIRCAKEYGADWVLCCDPDERFEVRFLRRLRILTARGRFCYVLHVRERWESHREWRCDGIWNDKSKECFFPLSDMMTFDAPFSHHISWAYREIRDNCYLTEFSLYHMKMIKHEDRVARAKLYDTLDPDHEMQSIGYDYLADPAGLVTAKIENKNRYDYRHLPDDLKNYVAAGAAKKAFSILI